VSTWTRGAPATRSVASPILVLRLIPRGWLWPVVSSASAHDVESKEVTRSSRCGAPDGAWWSRRDAAGAATRSPGGLS
jgi:hypothetical protein